MSGAGPVTIRLANALASRGLGDVEPSAPLSWDGAGSAAVRTARGLAGPIARASGRLAAVGDAMARRPLPVLAAAVFAVPLSQAFGAPGAGLAVAAVAGVALLCAAARTLHDGHERTIVLAALVAGALLRALFGVAISRQGGFPDEIGTYHPIAADAAACWRLGGASSMSSISIVDGRAAYFDLLTAAYVLFGPLLAAGRVLGGLLGLAAALAAGEVGRAMAGRRGAALAVAFLALHPEHAFWSVTLSRDTLSTLLVLVTFAIVLRRPARLLRGNALLVAGPLAVLAANSFVTAGALAATLVAMALAEAVTSAGPRRVPLTLAACALAVTALVLVGPRYGGWFAPQHLSFARLHGIGTRADFLPEFEFDTWIEVLAFVPLGAAFVLAAPWPWTAIHAGRAAYGLLAIGGLAIGVAGITGLVAVCRRRPGAAAPVVLFALAYLALLCVLEGNAGIVVRHRLPLTACLAVCAGALFAGLSHGAQRTDA